MLAHIQPKAASSNPTYTESVMSALSETALSVAASSIAVSDSSEQANGVSDVDQT